MMILNPVNIFIFKKGNLKKKRFLLPFYWNIYGSNNNVFIHIYIYFKHHLILKMCFPISITDW